MVTGMRGDRARSDLAGTRFADVRWVAETGSTNRDLLDLAAGGGADGVVLVADHQSAGRGRLDRSWHAPADGSLLLSVLFRPTSTDAHLLTTAVGVAAAEACRMVADVAPLLKWPNDLVVAGADGVVRKLSGILAESTVTDGRLDVVVVGLGLNVNWPDPESGELPDDLASTATALNHVCGHLVDREELLVVLLQRLDHWCRQPAAELVSRYRSLSATIGARVRVDLGTEQVVGVAAEVTDSGSLLVDVDDGPRREIVVGDVVHLRPAD
jgi:BirA family transcriptional regulator, biotin operon repressor / biotin---[acetyl-CoA-carboxylase] ligase